MRKNRLRDERKLRGWTQSKLAVESGVGIGEISRLENGVLKPSTSQAERLARVMGLAPARLFGEHIYRGATYTGEVAERGVEAPS